MGRIKKEDLRGIEYMDGVNSYVKCRNCMSEDDYNNMKDSEIITDEDIEKIEDEDEILFCDTCGNRF